MAAHFEGLGFMEQYEYRKAVEAFREVHELAPGWIPGSINLAIALLNDSGVKAEEAKKAGGGRGAEQLRRGPASSSPASSSATRTTPTPISAGASSSSSRGDLAEAHQHFKRVTEIDPNDAAAWYWAGSTADRPRGPAQPAGPRPGEGADRALRQGARAAIRT